MTMNTQVGDGHLDATFAALSDATRRRILERLALGDASVGELTALFQLTQPTISKHLQVLSGCDGAYRKRYARWWNLLRAGRREQY